MSKLVREAGRAVAVLALEVWARTLAWRADRLTRRRAVLDRRLHAAGEKAARLDAARLR